MALLLHGHTSDMLFKDRKGNPQVFLLISHSLVAIWKSITCWAQGKEAFSQGLLVQHPSPWPSSGYSIQDFAVPPANSHSQHCCDLRRNLDRKGSEFLAVKLPREDWETSAPVLSPGHIQRGSCCKIFLTCPPERLLQVASHKNVCQLHFLVSPEVWI